MYTKILRLNKAGHAIQWIGLEAAACLYAREQIVWTYGERVFRLHGGKSRISGSQTVLDIASVIATEGKVCVKDSQTPKLCNASLFQRDQSTCMYCGRVFSRALLTRDHIYPTALGGKDIWENCITACKSCNNHKGCRTPEEAGMRLLAVPFRPNKSEYLAFANRSVLTDQMDFLSKGFSKNMKRI